MTCKARRRLDLQLPEDHPIFSYPKGVRSAVAREWLDIGAAGVGCLRDDLQAARCGRGDGQGVPGCGLTS